MDAPTPTLPPLSEPHRHDWDDDPRTCARYDRWWGENDYDIHRDEDS
ncbi:hypothetical protein JL475_00430 [Streptomyces sp. M2CJ-2]|nr:hypothetical protein [Streptomyces sp. M2CJ-2]MBL3664512.1 hypothetical protein [Streptomyces sp. M2CJ-2]